MTDFTNEEISEVNEALFNIGKLAGRINGDEGKRLFLLMQIISSYMERLSDDNQRLRGLVKE